MSGRSTRCSTGHWLIGSLLLAGLVTACGDGQQAVETTSASATVSQKAPSPSDLPDVDLSSMDGAAREQLAAADHLARQALDANADLTTAQRAARVGELCALYYAVDIYGAAGQCYDLALRLEPNAVGWHYERALTALALNDAAGAERHFASVLDAQADDLPTLLRLGRLLLDEGRLDDASRYFERALALDPDAAAALAGSGLVAERRGQADRAIEQLEAALARQPAATALHYPLGQLYRRQGDLERAAEHLQRAGEREVKIDDPRTARLASRRGASMLDIVRNLAADVERLSTAELLGFVIGELGDADGTAAALRRTLEGDSAEEETAELEGEERARAFYVLAALEASRGRHQPAREAFSTALSLDSSLLDAYVLRAASSIRLGELDAAARDLEAVTRAAASASDITERRARRVEADLLIGQNLLDDAATLLERLVDEQPNDGASQLRLASVLERMGRHDDALAAYAAAVERGIGASDRALAFYRSGRLQRATGELSAAVSSLRAAVDSDPAFHAARVELAGALAQSGDLRQAVELYRQAVDNESNDPTARLGEASALILLGEHRQARQRLEAALTALPRNARIGATLARHLAASPQRDVRDGARALELARALMAAEASPQHRETLAMALAESGRFDEAAREQSTLIEMAKAAGQEQVAVRLRADLERYRLSQPCCATGQ